MNMKNRIIELLSTYEGGYNYRSKQTFLDDYLENFAE